MLSSARFIIWLVWNLQSMFEANFRLTMDFLKDVHSRQSWRSAKYQPMSSSFNQVRVYLHEPALLWTMAVSLSLCDLPPLHTLHADCLLSFIHSHDQEFVLLVGYFLIMKFPALITPSLLRMLRIQGETEARNLVFAAFTILARSWSASALHDIYCSE